MFGPFKRTASKPDPVPASSPPPPVKEVASAPVPEPSEESIPVPFSDIAARLSGALAPRASAVLAGSFPLPVKTALEQLPSGAVRIRFAQLRQAAPSGTFSDDASLDETLVDLPLPKILAAMDPALLARRPGQTKVTVGANIPNLFGKPGQ